jgi:hypothetical protein
VAPAVLSIPAVPTELNDLSTRTAAHSLALQSYGAGLCCLIASQIDHITSGTFLIPRSKINNTLMQNTMSYESY